MEKQETEQIGQKVIDHFTAKPHNPWESAETLADREDGIQVVRVFLRMQRFNEAYSIYQGELSNALIFNIADYAQILSLLRPFFSQRLGRRTCRFRRGYSKEVSAELCRPCSS
jgi:hypothetical protein